MSQTNTTTEAGTTGRSYTVLARRYRSRDFDELVGQEPIARTLRNAIAAERTAHAYLFSGTRGVGKTSMARIFARALNATEELTEAAAVGEAILRGDDLDVIEIDGASNRGVQEARDLIAGAGLSPTRCRYKIYIIDEVHMLTREAFNALLKTMEEPPEHVKFILCTTEPQKVPATIQSRCQRFDFRAITTTAIAGQLRSILGQEGIEADEDVVMQVARLGRGSMRDALSLLDRLLAADAPRLNATLVEEMLGLPDHTLVLSLVNAMISSEPGTALDAGAELLARGATVEQALEMLTEHLRSLMVIAACGADSELVELAPDALETATQQAAHFDIASLVYMIAVCDATARSARDSALNRALFDAALVRLCLTEQLASIPAMLTGAPATPAQPKKKVVDSIDRQPIAAAPAPPATRPAPPVAPVPAAPSPHAVPAASATVVEVKQRADVADDEVWDRVLEMASASPSDEAKIRHLVFLAIDGRTLRLAVNDTGAASERFLRAQGEWLEGMVERATGRRVKVEFEEQASTAPAPAEVSGASLFEAARQLPAVRQAMDVFDATVSDVQETPAPSTERDSEEGAGDVR